MSDKFYPQSLVSLLIEVMNQLNTSHEVLGLPISKIFNPDLHQSLKIKRYGQVLANPYGVAAGPHSQLSRNIVSAWLMGARYIELKTIQTLDEIEVSKPCIDIQDEGYNCEWSQELKIEQSYNEYLNAWIIIHFLHHHFNWEGEPETIFNMSVGYNMEGILNENVQWYFQKMADCSVDLERKKDAIREFYPQIDKFSIPSCISDNITLSTMHGCPSNEIEEISEYLISKRNLHTTVKLNPTLLGKDELRKILNETLEFPIEVPDEAFNHDIKYPEAINLIQNLQSLSNTLGLQFGVKFTNTLEVTNRRGVLPEEMNYMSGRALHPISIALAAKVQQEFSGQLDISFSGGADAENIVPIVNSGLFPVTVSSDLLKPGSYTRLAQYYKVLSDEFNTNKQIYKSGESQKKNQLEFLINYTEEVKKDKRYKYEIFHPKNIKSDRELNKFDCIAAPCMDACPTEQDIPDYLYWASKGNFDKALDIIYQKNPLPRTLGLVCEHGCQTKCTRINYEDPVRIRDIKEFIATHGHSKSVEPKEYNGLKVAIIGAGPSGLSAAWFLAIEGCEVEIFEKLNKPGGMPQSVIPDFRLNQDSLQADIDRILGIGVKINYNFKIGETHISQLEKDFHYVYIAAGAELSKTMSISGEDAPIVMDPLKFLRNFKNGEISELIGDVLVIGGGNTAMDVARAVNKLVRGNVTIVYRRTIGQMPAEAQEIEDALIEGVLLEELLSPVKIIEKENGFILQSQRMRVLDEKAKDGRNKVTIIDNEFVNLKANYIIPAIGQDVIPIVKEFNSVQNLDNANHSIKIYMGGDASRGASSIVQAVGDGRFFAEHILSIEDLVPKGDTISKDLKKTKREHLSSRSQRLISEYPVDISLANSEMAIQEASRCLQCDEYCNVCVSVCPNRANHYYSVLPQNFVYHNIHVSGHSFELSESFNVNIKQDNQIFNVADYCNECGNCTTFCPTSGDPYIDKPHIHLSKASFEESDKGFYFSNDEILMKKDGILSISKFEGGKIYYEDDKVEIILAHDSLNVLDVFIKQEGEYIIYLDFMIDMKLLFDA